MIWAEIIYVLLFFIPIIVLCTHRGKCIVSVVLFVWSVIIAIPANVAPIVVNAVTAIGVLIVNRVTDVRCVENQDVVKTLMIYYSVTNVIHVKVALTV